MNLGSMFRANRPFSGLYAMSRSFGGVFARGIRFPTCDKPEVSIVVMVDQCGSDLRHCLVSLSRSGFSGVSVEVLVLDATPDGSGAKVAHDVGGVQYIRLSAASHRLSVLERLNTELVCFLNAAVVVSPNWLQPLVDLLRTDAEVQLVGPLILSAEGPVFGAGGVVDDEVKSTLFGAGFNPTDPMLLARRSVDFCSSLCFVARREPLLECAHSRSQPPGDLDGAWLGLALRERAHKGTSVTAEVNSRARSVRDCVQFVPASRVALGVSATSIVEKSVGVEFAHRWKRAIPDLPDSGSAYALSRRWRNAPTIVLIEAIPRHDFSAGHLRVMELIWILQKLGCNLVYVISSGEAFEPYTSELRAMGIDVLFDINQDSKSREQFFEMLPVADLVWVARPDPTSRYLPAIRAVSQVPVVFDTIDLHFLRMKRELEVKKERTVGDEGSYLRMQDLESKLAQECNGVIAITEVEAKVLQQLGAKQTWVIPTIHSSVSGEHRAFEERSGILFIGNYWHSPNEDAALWMCNEIMPRIWKTHPDLKLTLLGSNPSKAVRRLRSSRVIVPGHVKVIDEYFQSNRVFLAPLRFGAGMKGKIGQSMGLGLPVITTSIGAEGMDLIAETNILLGDTADELARQVIRLYEDGELWAKLAQGGHEAIHKFSPAACQETIVEMFRALGIRGHFL